MLTGLGRADGSRGWARTGVRCAEDKDKGSGESGQVGVLEVSVRSQVRSEVLEASEKGHTRFLPHLRPQLGLFILNTSILGLIAVSKQQGR